MLSCAGYKSVAHYLVLTHQADAPEPSAKGATAIAAAEEPAAISAEATPGSASKQANGEPSVHSTCNMQLPWASFGYCLSLQLAGFLCRHCRPTPSKPSVLCAVLNYQPGLHE